MQAAKFVRGRFYYLAGWLWTADSQLYPVIGGSRSSWECFDVKKGNWKPHPQTEMEPVLCWAPLWGVLHFKTQTVFKCQWCLSPLAKQQLWLNSLRKRKDRSSHPGISRAWRHHSAVEGPEIWQQAPESRLWTTSQSGFRWDGVNKQLKSRVIFENATLIRMYPTPWMCFCLREAVWYHEKSLAPVSAQTLTT